MKYIFIINNFGNRDGSIIFNQIRIICNNLGIDYEIEINSNSYTTEMILEKYKDTRNVLIAVGGDGMINKVVNGVVNTNNLLGFIPYGTGNDFSKAVNETITDKITPIDVVKINDRYFVNIACFGIDADIANDEKFIHSKIIPKSQRYNISTIYHFIKYQAREFEIYVDNEILHDEYSTLVVANARYYGGGYKIGTNSIINDGIIEVYLFTKMKKLKMAKSILGMKTGKHELIPELTKFKTDKLIIKSPNIIRCNIDGEILESDSFDIQVIPNAIKLYNNPELTKKLLNK